MPTIHEQIDELLAADLHGELSAAERDAFHAHLVECADCRQAFQEEKNMHKLLNETLAARKPISDSSNAWSHAFAIAFRNAGSCSTGHESGSSPRRPAHRGRGIVAEHGPGRANDHGGVNDATRARVKMDRRRSGVRTREGSAPG